MWTKTTVVLFSQQYGVICDGPRYDDKNQPLATMQLAISATWNYQRDGEYSAFVIDQPYGDQSYRLTHVITGKVLDSGTNQIGEAVPVLNDYNGSSGQQWIIGGSGASCTLTCAANSQVLSVNPYEIGGVPCLSPAPGTTLWSIAPQVRVILDHTNQCLAADYVKYQLFMDDFGASYTGQNRSQIWIIRPTDIDENTYMIQLRSPYGVTYLQVDDQGNPIVWQAGWVPTPNDPHPENRARWVMREMVVQNGFKAHQIINCSSGEWLVLSAGVLAARTLPLPYDHTAWTHNVRVAIDANTPFNQLTFPMAHDSHTDKKTSIWSWIPTTSPEWEDQNEDVTEQLNGGIRAVRISTGLFNEVFNQDAVLVHSIVLKHFGPYLRRVQAFLAANPGTIVTIYDEGDDDDKETFENKIAGVYAQIFGGDPSAPTGVFCPGQNGMPPLSELQAGSWPTLSEMVAAGVQIVVLMENGYPCVKNPDGSFTHPWMLPAPSLMVATPFNYVLSDSTGPTVRPAVADVNPVGTLGSNLFKLNHFFYAHVHGHTESSQPFNIWTVGDLLVEDTLRAFAVNGRGPNFINVDFFQGVQGARSHLVALVAAVNASQTVHELEVKVKGCFVQNANVLQIGAPYTFPVDTPLYQLVCAAKDANGNPYALSSSEPEWNGSACVALASLQPVEQSLPGAQLWFLRYNTPEHGIQLVNHAPGVVLGRDGDARLLHETTGTPPYNLSVASSGGLWGAPDAGWEFVYDASDDTYTIRKSGDASMVLGVTSDSIGSGSTVGLVSASSSDPKQRWRVVPLNSVPYPPFLPPVTGASS